MSKQDNRIFKLTSFSPIGFMKPNYPVKFCSLCRGYLVEVCNECLEKHHEVCEVINQENTYYHKHCYSLMNSTNKTPIPKDKNEIESDTESTSF